MKIVIIGSAHPLRGGIAALNERLALALQDEGHEVIIYSFSLQYPGFLFPGKSQFTDEPAPDHLTIKSRINSINPFNWLRVGAMIAAEQPDLVIVRYWIPFMALSTGTILRRIKKKCAATIIAILDNVIPHEKRPGDAALTRYFLKPINGFLSMSHEVLADLRTFDTRKPAVYSPHPVYDNYGTSLPKDEACRMLNLPADRRYVLFFGLIRRYKGLDLLLEAMADPRVRAADIHLIVAGEYYGEQQYYEDLITTLAISDRVHLFTHFVPTAEVRAYFSAADCVVQPYRRATQSGISQIAYHFEKPMVVTDVGGLPEIVPDGRAGYVVKPDPRDIAEGMLRFYQNVSEVDFQRHLRQEKEKYSWSAFNTRIMDLYRQLSGG